VRRLVAAWQQEHERWQRRDLSRRRFVCIWADGVSFTPRLDHDRQCILVLIGADAHGHKELLAIEDGFRESARRPRRSADLRGFANRIKGLLAFDGASSPCGYATRTA
jgi:transposase-like protein